MAINGFDGDFELSLGSVVGVRAFKLDWLGRLVGVSETTSVFKRGINQAECYRCHLNRLADCECGFYGYFSGQDNQYMTGNPVGAIIEGTGRTVIGTKGFRTEKAELVALFPMKNRSDSNAPGPIARVTRKFYPSAEWFIDTARRGVDGFWGFGSLFLTAALLVTGIVFLLGPYWAVGVALFTVLPGPAGFLRRMVYIDSGDDKKLRKITRSARKSTPKAPDPFDRLHELYPDVPIYKSLQEAVKKHPLSTAEEHIPEPVLPSPATEDNFWELPTTPRKNAYVR